MDKLGVDPRITRFVLPIGSSVNMDGAALYMAISTVFIAQLNGIVLDFGDLVTVLLTTTLVSLSLASVPSSSLLFIVIVLQAVDVPANDVTLLFVVEWIL